MRQWRILHTESSRGWGGQEMRVFAELDWMRAHGQWVALAAHPSSAIARHAVESGMTFFSLRTHKLALPFEILRLARWLGKNRIDVVNTHSSNDGWIAGLAARLTGRAILIRSRHIEVDYPHRFWSRVAYRSLPLHVLTTSQRIADRLVAELQVPVARATCVSTGVDLDRFQPREKGTLRSELSLAPEIPLVGMISVLRSWKGHASFLEAIARILEKPGPPVHFIICGDGPGRNELAEKIAQPPFRDHVSLLGHRADIPNVLASLDVLVLPSLAHEGIPQIILQAQAMARAVVATTVGGIPEVVQDNLNGLLVPPREPALLADKIQLLLDQPDLRSRLGRNARLGVEKNHSLDAMGGRLLDLYTRLAAAASN